MNEKQTEAFIKKMRLAKKNGSLKDFFDKNVKIIKKSPESIYTYAKLTNKPLNGFEKSLSRSPRYSYYYLAAFKNKLNSEVITILEKAIGKSSEYSLRYAHNFKSKTAHKFELGEKAIAKSASASLEYAYLIGKRFELGEEAISKDAKLSVDYAADVMQGRFELGEKAIAKDAYASYNYAQIIGERFELGEPAIKKDDPYYKLLSYNYYELVADLMVDRSLENKTRIADKDIEKNILGEETPGSRLYFKYKNIIKNIILEDLKNDKSDVFEKYGDLEFFSKIICELSCVLHIPEEINNFMIVQGLIDSKNKLTKKYIKNCKTYKDKVLNILKRYQGKTVDEVISILCK